MLDEHQRSIANGMYYAALHGCKELREATKLNENTKRTESKRVLRWLTLNIFLTQAWPGFDIAPLTKEQVQDSVRTLAVRHGCEHVLDALGVSY